MTKHPQEAETDLTEAEIAARFESTVRRMANTPPSNKLAKQHAERATVDAKDTLINVALRAEKTKSAIAASKNKIDEK